MRRGIRQGDGGTAPACPPGLLWLEGSGGGVGGRRGRREWKRGRVPVLPPLASRGGAAHIFISLVDVALLGDQSTHRRNVASPCRVMQSAHLRHVGSALACRCCLRRADGAAASPRGMGDGAPFKAEAAAATTAAPRRGAPTNPAHPLLCWWGVALGGGVVAVRQLGRARAGHAWSCGAGRGAVWCGMRCGHAVRDTVWDAVRDAVRDAVWDAVCDAVWDAVCDAVRHAAGGCGGVRDAVRDVVRDAVRRGMRRGVQCGGNAGCGAGCGVGCGVGCGAGPSQKAPCPARWHRAHTLRKGSGHARREFPSGGGEGGAGGGREGLCGWWGW